MPGIASPILLMATGWAAADKDVDVSLVLALVDAMVGWLAGS